MDSSSDATFVLHEYYAVIWLLLGAYLIASLLVMIYLILWVADLSNTLADLRDEEKAQLQLQILKQLEGEFETACSEAEQVRIMDIALGNLHLSPAFQYISPDHGVTDIETLRKVANVMFARQRDALNAHFSATRDLYHTKLNQFTDRLNELSDRMKVVDPDKITMMANFEAKIAKVIREINRLQTELDFSNKARAEQDMVIEKLRVAKKSLQNRLTAQAAQTFERELCGKAENPGDETSGGSASPRNGDTGSGSDDSEEYWEAVVHVGF